jgi:hypothetical protein
MEFREVGNKKILAIITLVNETTNLQICIQDGIEQVRKKTYFNYKQTFPIFDLTG